MGKQSRKIVEEMKVPGLKEELKQLNVKLAKANNRIDELETENKKLKNDGEKNNQKK
jgi:FtsZ-binding cell division protein ZapB